MATDMDKMEMSWFKDTGPGMVKNAEYQVNYHNCRLGCSVCCFGPKNTHLGIYLCRSCNSQGELYKYFAKFIELATYKQPTKLDLTEY